MKNSILRYSFLELKNNKITYLWDLISYSLFVCIAIIVGLLSNSIVRSHSTHLNDTFGSYDVCIINADVTESKYIELTKKYDTGYCYITDYVEHSNGMYYSVGYFDDLAYEQMSISLVSGRMPENNYEIAIEESVLYLLSEQQNDKNTITLQVNDFYGNSYNRSYEIVGIIKNYTHLTPKLSNGESGLPYNLFPSILIQQKNDTRAYAVHAFAANLEDQDLSFFGTGNYLINESKTSQNSTVLYVGLGVLFVFLIVLGMVNLYCNIIIHKKKNLELFFRMKCAGATNKACIRFKLGILLILLIGAILVGATMGVICSWMLTKMIQVFFVEYISFHTSAFIIGISSAITAITILILSLAFDLRACFKRPLELNIEQKNDSKALRLRVDQFKRHPCAVFAVKHVYANTAKYIAILLSIIAILFTAVLVQLFITGISQSYDQNMKYDYYVKTFNGSTITSLSIPLTNNSFGNEDVENIMATNEVKACYAYSQNSMYILLDSGAIEPPSHILENQKEQYSFSEDSLIRVEKEYVQYGYEENSRLYKVNLHGVNDAFMQKLLANNEADVDNEVVLLTLMDSGYYKEGDSIMFTAPRFGKDGEIHRVDIETTIGKIITIDESSPFYGLYNGTGYFFCISQDVIDEKIAQGYHDLIIHLCDKTQYSATEKILNQLDVIHAADAQYESLSNREENEEKWKLVMLTQTIGAIIIIATMLYLLITLITVFRNDLYSQKKTWGHLRTAGLKQNQAITLQCTIVFFLNLLAFCISFLLMGILMLVLETPDREYVFSILSPFSIVLPPILITLISQLVTIIVIKQFWQMKLTALIQ